MAICSALASTWPWPMAVDPTSSSPWIFAAAGSVLSAAPAIPGSRLKPKRSAVGHQPRGAELDAERGEHGVAGHREGQFERAAAVLAVGVAQLHAVERRVRRIGEDAVRAGDSCLQHAR